MLTLTENCQSIVREISGQPGNPDSAGLRITTQPDTDQGQQGASLAVTATAQGEPGDQLVTQEGAHVYLDEPAAQLLDDKVLDAAVDPEGNVEFALAQQG